MPAGLILYESRQGDAGKRLYNGSELWGVGRTSALSRSYSGEHPRRNCFCRVQSLRSPLSVARSADLLRRSPRSIRPSPTRTPSVSFPAVLTVLTFELRRTSPM